jgi:CheY-like chemotaxis protein/HPt (histidine-containing phosphotransfer) domain-containing protein
VTVHELGSQGAGYRVLVADDTAASRRLLAYYLECAGVDVEVAADGKLACDAVRAASGRGAPFDGVLMDVSMPVLDGYQATAVLRREGFGGPIIALTAHVRTVERAACLQAGCDDVLSKPVELETLLEALSRHLAGGPRTRNADALSGSPRRPDVRAEEAGPVVSTLAGGPTLIRLVEQFLDDLRERTAAITRSLVQGDLETLASVAHQLRGTAGAYGFAPVEDAARVLEADARAQAAPGELARSAARVIDLCGRARAPRVTTDPPVLTARRAQP